MEKKESKTTKVKNSEDIKKVLCEQMVLLAAKSEECVGAELHFTSSTILGIGKYLNEYYFDPEVEQKPL